MDNSQNTVNDSVGELREEFIKEVMSSYTRGGILFSETDRDGLTQIADWWLDKISAIQDSKLREVEIESIQEGTSFCSAHKEYNKGCAVCEKTAFIKTKDLLSIINKKLSK